MRSKSTTERWSREDDAKQLKLDVRDVLAANKASDRHLADDVDIAPSLFSRRLDIAEKQAHLQLVDIVRMPLEVRVGILRMLAARDGYDVVKGGVAMDAKSAVLAASALLSSASATATETIAASEDNRLDRSEAVPLREKAAALRDQASSIVRICDSAIREGVVPLSATVAGSLQ